MLDRTCVVLYSTLIYTSTSTSTSVLDISWSKTRVQTVTRCTTHAQAWQHCSAARAEQHEHDDTLARKKEQSGAESW